MTIAEAEKILTKAGLTSNREELAFMVELINKGFDEFEKEHLGKTLNEGGFDFDNKIKSY